MNQEPKQSKWLVYRKIPYYGHPEFPKDPRSQEPVVISGLNLSTVTMGQYVGVNQAPFVLPELEPSTDQCWFKQEAIRYLEGDEEKNLIFATGITRDNFKIFLIPVPEDKEGALSAKEAANEGHWRETQEHVLPWPEPDLLWAGHQDFLEKLLKVEEIAQQIHWRGLSTCRLCGCTNGSVEFRYLGWGWPEGYKHYIQEHKVRPTAAFEAFVEESVRQLEGSD